MSVLPCVRQIFSSAVKSSHGFQKSSLRYLMSKQLVYGEFGDPCQVVKFRETLIPPLEDTDVLVRMLAAPVNPADINTIQGKSPIIPTLPMVPGDEGVGEVVEIGKLVSKFNCGNRVIFTNRMLGTWRYYGIFSERDLQTVSNKLGIPECAMLSIAPCTAYRLLKDFADLQPEHTVTQNAANSPVGQSVIQLCNAWGINTINIVGTHVGYEAAKKRLLNLGATCVMTLEQAEEMTKFETSLNRPILALNCMEGNHSKVLHKLVKPGGHVVNYGNAYKTPWTKQVNQSNVHFHRFDLNTWMLTAKSIPKQQMYRELMELIAIGKHDPPLYQLEELKNYCKVLKSTAKCDAFCNMNYVFDFTV